MADVPIKQLPTTIYDKMRAIETTAKDLGRLRVAEVMEPPFPTVDEKAPVVKLQSGPFQGLFGFRSLTSSIRQ